jgi:hypothetical protein
MDGEFLGFVALMIPVMALMIPIVAILTKPLTDAGKRRERENARKSYERIALEKLEVIKTAITMGYTHQELDALDHRLEKLIGADRLKTLLNDKEPGVPQAKGDLLDTDLDAEIRRLQDARQSQRR